MNFNILSRLGFKKKPKPGEMTVVRSIEDVRIAVEEGHGGTRKIEVSAWSPEIAKLLFFEVREKLMEKE